MSSHDSPPPPITDQTPSEGSRLRKRRALKIGDLVEPESESGDTDEQKLMAARALRQLKGTRTATTSSNSPDNGNLFEKVTSHPLISNSINYMLERTISKSSSYLRARSDEPITRSFTTESHYAPKRSSSLVVESYSSEDDVRKRPRLSQSSRSTGHSVSKSFPAPATLAHSSGLASELQQPLASQSSQSQPTPPPQDRVRFPREENLRQRVAVSSAISAQRSLQDLTELSVMNLTMASRRRLQMLIHFLKLGNSQLSERIESLIEMVETKRQGPEDESEGVDVPSRGSSTESFTASPRTPQQSESAEPTPQFLSDESIQQMKNDIVTTVKKIVNVVSKVSASSLSEPARSNVREVLLRLPSNWATLFEQEQLSDEQQQNGSDDDAASTYQDSKEYLPNGSASNAQPGSTSDSGDDKSKNETPSNNASPKPDEPASPRSVPQRLLANLFRFKGGVGSREDTDVKAKDWFSNKIRTQMTCDPNGKILILAQESLDMINKIIKFCNESLDKAETWNFSKQLQQRQDLISKLQNIDYVSSESEDGGDKETKR